MTNGPAHPRPSQEDLQSKRHSRSDTHNGAAAVAAEGANSRVTITGKPVFANT